jgi:ATP-dependent helicase HrpB
MLLPSLPIIEALPGLTRALESHHAAVLEAPPGAGKSTVVPLALLDAGWRGDQRILMLQPRRIAARAVARRMAELAGGEPGGLVGYRTRMDTRVGPATRIEVVTEGILTRMLQHDAALEGVACVIFDEFHERNLQADLGLALCLETQRHLRESLRLLVMSATLDGAALARLLGDAPVISTPGRMFPVETRYATSATDEIERRVASSAVRALEADPGDVLAFLSGAAEIRRTVAMIEERVDRREVNVLPLYGELPAAQQDAALRPSAPGSRKVVVATNIAETSLTIEGVRIVIDSGVERRQRFDPASGMNRLETVRISRASADQRRGRAGRTAPGVCYRLWTESAHQGLLPQASPEILEADLAPLALELACWGCDDPAELTWLDPPPPAALAQGRALLRQLEALDASHRITELGRSMARVGLHPRLAHMALRAIPLGLLREACEIAALLSERDPLRLPPGQRDPDLRVRLDCLHGASAPPGATVDAGGINHVRRVADQLERTLRQQARAQATTGRLTVTDQHEAGLLLAFAYPDRIGKTREPGSGRYLLSGGRGATLQRPASLAASDLIVVASLDAGDREALVHLGAPLTQPVLEQFFGDAIEERESVHWDPRSCAVVARRVRMLGQLVLSEEPLREGASDAIATAMMTGIREAGIRCLPWTPALEQWRARVNFARARDESGRHPWPDLSEEALLRTLEAWLQPWLDRASRLDHLSRVDLRAALQSMLDHAARRELDEFAPQQVTVPSGSRITIDYSSGEPVLAVRLQEVFGLRDSPRVARGRIPVTMQLLSPAQRPVQVTRDLASFWARGYADVKKELKGRYPKHYWPDDPFTAVPTHRVRPQGAR